jgi:SAM-dependent methyltransferase
VATKKRPSGTSKKPRARAARPADAKSRAKKAPRRSKKPVYTAKNADKHVLYQLSVQDAEVEVDFIDRVYRSFNKRRPDTLLEDFCGTALICSEWVKRSAKRRATGVDIDPKVLRWGEKHNLAKVGDARDRITLLRQDVRDPIRARFDVVCAFNFSYWVFRTRDEMRAYFRHARSLVAKDGFFALDAYGGWEAHRPMLERRKIRGGFTYVWDQNQFDAITHEVVNHIHFEFKNGSKLNQAFTYRWRFWSLPELQELLREAGFSDVQVFWDTASSDEENFRPRLKGQTAPGWLAYIVARP